MLATCPWAEGKKAHAHLVLHTGNYVLRQVKDSG